MGALMSTMKRKNPDAALNVYTQMKELHIKPDMPIYLLMVEIYAAKSMPDKMLEVYDILYFQMCFKYDNWFDTLTYYDIGRVHTEWRGTQQVLWWSNSYKPSTRCTFPERNAQV